MTTATTPLKSTLPNGKVVLNTSYLVSLHEIAETLYRFGATDAYLAMKQHIARHDELLELVRRELN